MHKQDVEEATALFYYFILLFQAGVCAVLLDSTETWAMASSTFAVLWNTFPTFVRALNFKTVWDGERTSELLDRLGIPDLETMSTMANNRVLRWSDYRMKGDDSPPKIHPQRLWRGHTRDREEARPSTKATESTDNRTLRTEQRRLRAGRRCRRSRTCRRTNVPEPAALVFHCQNCLELKTTVSNSVPSCPTLSKL